MISTSFFDGDYGFQNMFGCKPTFSTLVIKQVNSEYLFALKSKGIFDSVLKPLHDLTAIIKYFRNLIGLLFNSIGLVVEQNNYVTKIVNDCSICNLGNWLRITLSNYTLSCVFGATNIVKNDDRSKYVYTGCRISYDGAGSWSFGNYFAGSVLIFRADNCFIIWYW